MKRGTWAIVAAAIVASLAFGPAASAGNQAFWYGHVSRNHPVLFTTTTIDGVVNVEPILMVYKMSCPGFGHGDVEASFFGFEIPVRHHHFALNLKFPFERFHWGGDIHGDLASGDLSDSLPLFDRHGNPIACTTDGLTWNAHHVSTMPAGPAGSDVIIKLTVTKDPQGVVHVDVQH